MITSDYLEIIKRMRGTLDMANTDGTDSMPKSLADRLQKDLDLSLMTIEEREEVSKAVLDSAASTHTEVLRAKHGDLVFPDIVSACRVFGRVENLGFDDGIKAAIDKLKGYAKKQVSTAAHHAVNDQAPAMYDIEYTSKSGQKSTEKIMTTAVYVLTEDEMVELEKAILARHLTTKK